MADDNYRTHRSRGPRGDFDPRASDPLAELARLIGQGDPYADRGRHDDYAPGHPRDDGPAPALDWAAGESYQPQERADDRYTQSFPPPPPLPPPVPSLTASFADEPPPASNRFFSGPAAKFNGFRGEDSRDSNDQPAYAANEPAQYGDEEYAPDDYYDEPQAQPRRTGVVVVMAVLGLAVVGVSGAFAYRAMFGGYVLPSLPPIIRATTGPNKIMPSYGESQPNNANQLDAPSSTATEKMVSREEQPVNMEPPKVNSRVVSTIPLASSQSSPPGAAAPMPSASVPSSAPPMTATAQPASSFGAAPPAPMTAPVTVPASPAPALSSDPKKVHTITIRADQAGGSDVMATQQGTSAPPPLPVARPAARPAAPPRPVQQAIAPSTGGTAPLSIVPGADGSVAASAPSRTRVASQPVAVTNAPPTAVASTSSGGYSVQLTSQHSEADAEAAYQALQAKFPSQLGSRQAIIRRADLGSKGVFYRAMVGPFASMDEAAGICSSLKAAGGTCLVQRN